MRFSYGSQWLLVLVFVFVGTAHAGDTSSSDDTAQLPEVVVTAQKMSQPLEQVPASVSTLSGDFIRRTTSTDFTALQYYTANVNLQLGPSTGQFIIRGLGTVNSNDGFDPSVGTVIDGVYYGRSNFLSAFFFDIADFDVLRGPQGTLFGKNTTSGLIDLDTEPARSNFLIRSELVATDYGDRSFRPVIQVPLGENLAVRVSGNFEHGSRGVLFNTYLDRHERNTNQNAMRVRLRYTPSAQWLFDLEGFVTTSKQNYNIFQLVRVTDAMASVIHHYDPNAEFTADDRNSANVPSEEVEDIRGIALTGEYDLGRPWDAGYAKIVSVTGLAQARSDQVDLDADFSPVPFIRDSLTRPEPYRQFSQEFRVSGHAADFFGLGYGINFVSGIYFSHTALLAANTFSIQDLGAATAYLLAANAGGAGGQLLPGSTVGGIAGQLSGPIDTLLTLLDPVISPVIGDKQQANTVLDQRGDDWAWYAQTEQYFLPHWALIAGLRFGWERKQGYASSQSEGLLIGPASGGEVQPFAQTLHRFEQDVSPKIGFKWTPDKVTSVYATWTRGFKSGGFNAVPLNSTNLQYEPERASSYEIGAKTRTRLLGGPMETSASLFWTDFNDLQVSTLEGATFKILNAAAARSRGFDADLRWLPPIRNTSLYLSAGLADARYTYYPNAPAPPDSGQSAQDLTGRPLAFAPRWTFAVVPGYSVPLPYQASADFTLAVLYQGKRYLDVDDDPRKLQPATTLLNAQVTFHDRSRLWSLTLSAHNLTNELILDQIVNQPLAPGGFAAVRTDHGRYFAGDLTLSFD